MKHNSSGFVHAGKFQKASKMDYALSFSLRVDNAMREIVEDLHTSISSMTAEDETELYQ